MHHVVRPILGIARRGALGALRATRPRRSSSDATSRTRISIVVVNAFNAGGIMRSVVSVLPELAREHLVEVVSLTRDRDTPFYAIPDGVALVVLSDRRSRSVLSRVPSLLWHDADGAFPQMSATTDLELVRWLRSKTSGVVIGTRPALNNLLAELAAPGVVTVGQVHADLVSQHPALVAAVRRHHRRLTGLSVLTADHEHDYRALLAGADTRIARIPNAVPASSAGRSTHEARVVVAAARMYPEKGYDVLLDAFALLVEQHPDWHLRIFGQGPLRAEIEAHVDRLGLGDNVHLEGLTDRLDDELAAASIFVLSSRGEGFPMVLLEAMSHGLGVVSTDCDHGPRDIITPERDGLLVPVDDRRLLAAALVRLVEDREERERFGERAVTAIERYSARSVGQLWLGFLDDLRGRPAPKATGHPDG